MRISAYTASLDLQQAAEREQLPQPRSERASPQKQRASGDTVTVSEEARRLAAEMQQRREEKAVQEESLSLDSSSEKERAARRTASSPTYAMPQAGRLPRQDGASSEHSSTIEKQIEQLQSRLQNIAASTLPEGVKQSMMTSFQAQILELQAQLGIADRG